MAESNVSNHIKGIVSNLPETPGIYQYLNAEGTIIYVGKAKNLKRRVSSYFNREHPNGKTRILVSKIADIKYIVVKTEEDALLLENNLIKKYKPNLMAGVPTLYEAILRNKKMEKVGKEGEGRESQEHRGRVGMAEEPDKPAFPVQHTEQYIQSLSD